MNYPNLARLFRRLTLTEQAGLYACKHCGAVVPYELCYVHARRDELIDSIDQYVNDQTVEESQPTIPF